MKKTLLFICMGLILTALSGCVGEKEMRKIYVSDHINGRIVVLDFDLNWIASFPPPEEAVGCDHLTVDSDHVYFGITKIEKWLRTPPYTLIDTESVSGLNTLDDDDDYIYIFGIKSGDRVVQKYNKSDLSYVDEFDTGWNRTPSGIFVDDTYIYCTVSTTAVDNLKKFRKSDYGEEASVKITGDYYPHIGMDGNDTYICFTAGPGTGTSVSIHKKSDLSNYKVITGVASYGWDAAIHGDYVFVADYSDHVVRKIEISSGNVVATFGVQGVSGNDESHLNQPVGVAVGPEEEEAQPIIALIG